MGGEAAAKAARRQLRKSIGDDATVWAFQCFDVIKVRGFWGRMRWLFLGR